MQQETKKTSYFDFVFPSQNALQMQPTESLLTANEIFVETPESQFYKNQAATYDPAQIFGESTVGIVNDNSTDQEVQLTELKRDIEYLKEQYGAVSQHLHDNEESVDRLMDQVERVSQNNELIQMETKEARTWSETIANNKLVVGGLAAVSTLVVAVPLVATWFFKKGDKKEPKE